MRFFGQVFERLAGYNGNSHRADPIFHSADENNSLKRKLMKISAQFCLSVVTTALLILPSCHLNLAGPADKDDVASDKDDLEITYAPGDNAVSVTRNVNLPVQGNSGSSITWTTSDSDRISIDGTVSRPAADSPDVVVELTATLTRGTAADTKIFTLTVRAIDYPGTVTDIDGNIYTTVKIGSQIWTVENLRTTKFNDGAPVTHATDSSAWEKCTTAAYCYYNNTSDPDTISRMGALYNWYAARSEKLAPAGWHVPDTAEWDTLVKFLIANGYNWDGTRVEDKTAKALSAKTDWDTYTVAGAIGYNLTKNNRSGFTALPGGSRYYSGFFYDVGYYGLFWTINQFDAKNAYLRYLDYRHCFLHLTHDLKNCGLSVRLLKD